MPIHHYSAPNSLEQPAPLSAFALPAFSGCIGVIQGDRRQEYLAALLRDKHFSVQFIEQPEGSSLALCSVIIAPTPLTKDQKRLFGHPELSLSQFLSLLHPGQTLLGGSLPQQVREYCRKHGIAFWDFMDSETVSLRNAVATAEGTISEAIAASPVNLEGSQCLVAGYGRCGQVIAKKLRALEMDVSVFDHDLHRQSLAKKEGFPCIQSHALTAFFEDHPIRLLINTVPCPIFGESLIEKMPVHVVIMDIASAPGGVDINYCEKTGRTARLCPGLPGRYSPETSAQILCDALIDYLASRPVSDLPKDPYSASGTPETSLKNTQSNNIE